MQHWVIAIDGPAASGKSTTARRVAQELGFVHLDTGAMYRAVTLAMLRGGVGASDGEAVAALVEKTHVALTRDNGGVRVALNGEDVTEAIRSQEVTRAVSGYSSIRSVRVAMVREQRLIAATADVVAEGRDIGTVVFPHAAVKVFMVAGIEARARRRQLELEAQGRATPLATLMEQIAERDRLDSTREESPLRKAEDAVELDTSTLSIEEQVRFVVQLARERCGGKA